MTEWVKWELPCTSSSVYEGTVWGTPINKEESMEKQELPEDAEVTVEKAVITEFSKFIVLQDSATHRTELNEDDLDIEGVFSSYEAAVKAIKMSCRDSVDGWHEFSTGQKQEFFSRFGIYKLVAQVQPTLNIVAQIGYPIKNES